MDPQQALQQQLATLKTLVNYRIYAFDIFSTFGPVLHVKIIPDKTLTGGPSYGFVECRIHLELKLPFRLLIEERFSIWYSFVSEKHSYLGKFGSTGVFPLGECSKGGHCNPEVDDQVLSKAFSAFDSMSGTRVMWDPVSKKSRGYGFVAFRHKMDADKAIATMHGEFLGSRAIRVNWANQKGSQPKPAQSSSTDNFQTYEQVLSQSPSTNTTVYLGNLPPYTTQDHIIPFFQMYGYIVELRVQADRGFAFVKLSTHEQAASAIVGLQGTPINGRAVKCSWGRDKSTELSNFQQPQHPIPYGYSPYSHMAPLYGVSPMNYGVSTQGHGGHSNISALPGYEGYSYDYSQYYSMYGQTATLGSGYSVAYPSGQAQSQDPSTATQ